MALQRRRKSNLELRRIYLFIYLFYSTSGASRFQWGPFFFKKKLESSLDFFITIFFGSTSRDDDGHRSAAFPAYLSRPLAT